jgi:hypothetical protein
MPGVGNQTPNPAPSVLPGGTTVYPTGYIQPNPFASINNQPNRNGRFCDASNRHEEVMEQYMDQYKILLEKEAKIRELKLKEPEAIYLGDKSQFNIQLTEKERTGFLDTLKKFWT